MKKEDSIRGPKGSEAWWRSCSDDWEKEEALVMEEEGRERENILYFPSREVWIKEKD
jgi:hypothetical protein